MGLLSDPSLAPRNKLGKSLVKHSLKICLFLYFAGVLWFIGLGMPEINHGTYLSENALSPGLVYPEIKQDSSRLAQTFLDELRRERAKYKSTMPTAWITAKMKQIGLETYVHNFTLHYPFTNDKSYHGTNVYGILRAPRSSSTEGLVFSVPYRPPNSAHEDIVASVPVLLAFADFARRKNYWAKDLIFLVTDQEQLGTYAWLEAYHGGNANSKILVSGNVPVRAGALQAAINLEIQDLDIDHINVKIEGLNGQLPNLDLFNLVQRITSREGIPSSYMKSPRKRQRSEVEELKIDLGHILAMLLSQTTGVPTGNHGLFHQYRIESLTMVATKKPHQTDNNRHTTVLSLLRSLEGISRSLNNLLERFHQSYFFYILVRNDRFVSIGDYMPPLVLIISPLFIKAFLFWLTIGDLEQERDPEQDQGEDAEDTEDGDREKVATKAVQTGDTEYLRIFFFFGMAFALGCLCYMLPMNPIFRTILSSTFGQLNATNVTISIATIAMSSFLMPLFVKFTPISREFVQVFAMIIYGVALTVIGLLNYALGFFAGIISVPLIIIIPRDVTVSAKRRLLNCLYASFLNPFVFVYTIVLRLTLQELVAVKFETVMLQALKGSLDGITFAFMDCMIYGNWLYAIVTMVFLPLWVIFWSLATCSHKTPSAVSPTNSKEKIN